MKVSSGSGIKIWCKAQLPGKGIHKPVADGAIGPSRQRFFCVSGDRWLDAPLEIEEQQANLTALYEWRTPSTSETALGL